MTASFFIFKTLKALGFSKIGAFIAALIYAVNPSQFNTYYWISGGATAIGFCFFIISFFYHLKKQERLTLCFFTLSILASEAMIVGLVIILVFDFLRREGKILKTNIGLFLISFFFLIAKIFLTPKSTFDSYKIMVSPAVLGALKYYILRSFGFPGVSKDQLVTVILLFWVFAIAIFFLNNLKKYTDLTLLKFFFAVFIVGLFPFVLIPTHLAANYINIPIFSVGSFIGMTLSKVKLRYAVVMILAFIFIAFFSVQLIEQDNWVTQRANLAYYYISQIDRSNLPSGSTLIFADNSVSSSYDAYIALGQGDAIGFWFKDKNYKTCFSVFENCNNLP